MLLVTFHLPGGSWTDAQLAAMLQRSRSIYAEALAVPMSRVSARIAPHPVLVLNEAPDDLDPVAPYFTFTVFTGTPRVQKHFLLWAFTDVLVEYLDIVRDSICGRAEEVDPDDCAVGGVPAGTRVKASRPNDVTWFQLGCGVGLTPAHG